VLKLLLPMMGAVLVAQASTVTTATCTAGTQTTSLQNASDPLSCFGTGQSLFATGFTAYRVSAEATTNHLSVDARGGFLSFVGDSVIARAEASLVGTDSVIFPGQGLATLRLTLATHFIGVPQDSSGGFGFAVNGLSQSVAMPPITPLGTIFTDRDYLIELGVATQFRWVAGLLAVAGPERHESGELIFGTARMRLYDANGQPMPGTVGLGVSANYPVFFGDGETEQGPVLAQHMPEPSTFVFMLPLVVLYIVRKLRTCSLLPHVT
jgi:hypothetical protein